MKDIDRINFVREMLEDDDEVRLWRGAKERLDGAWKYVLIDSAVPNAFVSESLPNRVFVTTALFRHFVSNDDELALILGHELSHVIFAHASDENYLKFILRVVEILLLSMDPTEGLLSIGFMSLLGFSRNALGQVHSQMSESEADELGIKLAAMACYDTKRAARVFHKMHLFDVQMAEETGTSSPTLSIMRSHPLSEDRYKQMIQLSEEENKHKYEDSTCASLRSRLNDMMHWKRKSTVAAMTVSREG
jgi:Zn-dependent protease with chaperone function